jgi:hypothetical protein
MLQRKFYARQSVFILFTPLSSLKLGCKIHRHSLVIDMTRKAIALAATIVAILAICTGMSAFDKETKIRQIKPGMNKTQVEALLGPGKTDGSSDGANHKWPSGRLQYSYEGNPSLWYLRWEDALIIGYTNDSVSDIQRCGL